jgi:hypothetical protein
MKIPILLIMVANPPFLIFLPSMPSLAMEIQHLPDFAGPIRAFIFMCAHAALRKGDPVFL